MSKLKQDNLGDLMKSYEKVETDRKVPKGSVMYARLDGRAFHTFTRGLKRPYDWELTQLMQATTKFLVQETNALIGYTQSDEISLVWYLPPDSEAEYMFDGKLQKINSNLAAMASSFFNLNVEKYLPEKSYEQTGKIQVFDCRVMSLPSLYDAYLMLWWRERDAIKNSITMLAAAHFGHAKLQNMNSLQKKDMLRNIDDPWERYPNYFKKGTYFARVVETRFLTEAELSKIPEAYRPTKPVSRASVNQINLPDLGDLKDLSDAARNQVIFPGIFLN